MDVDLVVFFFAVLHFIRTRQKREKNVSECLKCSLDIYVRNLLLLLGSWFSSFFAFQEIMLKSFNFKNAISMSSSLQLFFFQYTRLLVIFFYTTSETLSRSWLYRIYWTTALVALWLIVCAHNMKRKNTRISYYRSKKRC
jgi:hypothetical protein